MYEYKKFIETNKYIGKIFVNTDIIAKDLIIVINNFKFAKDKDIASKIIGDIIRQNEKHTYYKEKKIITLFPITEILIANTEYEEYIKNIKSVSDIKLDIYNKCLEEIKIKYLYNYTNNVYYIDFTKGSTKINNLNNLISHNDKELYLNNFLKLEKSIYDTSINPLIIIENKDISTNNLETVSILPYIDDMLRQKFNTFDDLLFFCNEMYNILLNVKNTIYCNILKYKILNILIKPYVTNNPNPLLIRLFNTYNKFDSKELKKYFLSNKIDNFNILEDKTKQKLENLKTLSKTEIIESIDIFSSPITFSNWIDETISDSCIGIGVTLEKSKKFNEFFMKYLYTSFDTSIILSIDEYVNMVVENNIFTNKINTFIPLYIHYNHWFYASNIRKYMLSIYFKGNPLNYNKRMDNFYAYVLFYSIIYLCNNLNNKNIRLTLSILRTYYQIMKENKIINSIMTKNLDYDKIIIIIQLITLKISDDIKINNLINDNLIIIMNNINKYVDDNELKNKYKNEEIDIFNKILNFYNVFVNNIKYKTIGHFIKNIDDNFGIVSDSDCEYFINILKKQSEIIDRSKYLTI